MSLRARRRVAASALALVTVGIGLTGCGGGDEDGGSSSAACRDFEEYGTFQAATVTIMSATRDVEAENFTRSFRPFERCTGIKIQWDGRADFEAQYRKLVDEGKPPPLAVLPQPGLLQYGVASGLAKAATPELEALAKQQFHQEWLDYGTVDGTYYAAPLGANVKSWVWYSPTTFKRNGWKVPATWDQLRKLTDTIATKGKMKPWCAGIESQAATGWPATDWVEDVVLRLDGPDVYAQWVDHRIPFSDPRIMGAFDEVGAILRNPAYVNGGYGPVASIATTSFNDAGLPILDNECAMHRQASFYVNQWPQGTDVDPGGDVWAFYLPAKDDQSKPVLIGGEFVARFSDDAAVKAVQQYLATPEYANDRAELGGWISPSKGLGLTSVPGQIDKESVRLLQDPATTVAFDGSDMMPGVVGSGAFWTEITKWIKGQSTQDTVSKIDAAWPK